MRSRSHARPSLGTFLSVLFLALNIAVICVCAQVDPNERTPTLTPSVSLTPTHSSPRIATVTPTASLWVNLKATAVANDTNLVGVALRSRHSYIRIGLSPWEDFRFISATPQLDVSLVGGLADADFGFIAAYNTLKEDFLRVTRNPANHSEVFAHIQPNAAYSTTLSEVVRLSFARTEVVPATEQAVFVDIHILSTDAPLDSVGLPLLVAEYVSTFTAVAALFTKHTSLVSYPGRSVATVEQMSCIWTVHEANLSKTNVEGGEAVMDPYSVDVTQDNELTTEARRAASDTLLYVSVIVLIGGIQHIVAFFLVWRTPLLKVATMETYLISLQYPALPYTMFLFFLQRMLHSSVVVATRGDDFTSAGYVVIFVVLAFVAIVLNTVRGDNFLAEWWNDKREKRAWRMAVDYVGEWETTEMRYVERYGAFFNHLGPDAQSFLNNELVFIVADGLIGGIRSSSETQCYVKDGVGLFFHLAFFVTAVTGMPFCSRPDNIIFLVMHSLQLLARVLALFFNAFRGRHTGIVFAGFYLVIGALLLATFFAMINIFRYALFYSEKGLTGVSKSVKDLDDADVTGSGDAGAGSAAIQYSAPVIMGPAPGSPRGRSRQPVRRAWDRDTPLGLDERGLVSPSKLDSIVGRAATNTSFHNNSSIVALATGAGVTPGSGEGAIPFFEKDAHREPMHRYDVQPPVGGTGALSEIPAGAVLTVGTTTRELPVASPKRPKRQVVDHQELIREVMEEDRQQIIDGRVLARHAVPACGPPSHIAQRSRSFEGLLSDVTVVTDDPKPYNPPRSAIRNASANNGQPASVATPKERSVVFADTDSSNVPSSKHVAVPMERYEDSLGAASGKGKPASYSSFSDLFRSVFPPVRRQLSSTGGRLRSNVDSEHGKTLQLHLLHGESDTDSDLQSMDGNGRILPRFQVAPLAEVEPQMEGKPSLRGARPTRRQQGDTTVSDSSLTGTQPVRRGSVGGSEPQNTVRPGARDDLLL